MGERGEAGRLRTGESFTCPFNELMSSTALRRSDEHVLSQGLQGTSLSESHDRLDELALSASWFSDAFSAFGPQAWKEEDKKL